MIWLFPFLLAGLLAYAAPAILPSLMLVSICADLMLPLGPLHVYSNEWALAGACLGLAARRIQLGSREWKGVPSWLGWSFVPLAAILAAHAFFPGPAGASFKAVLRAAELWLGLALAVLCLKTDAQRQRALNFFLFWLASVSLFGLAQTLAGPGHPLNQGREIEVFYGRMQAAASFFRHHNQFSVFLASALPLCLAALVQGEKKDRLLAAAALVLGLMALACTFSRGAWLALALAGVLWSFFLPGPWRWRILLGLAGAFLILFLAGGPAFRQRLGNLASDSDRAGMARIGLKIWDGKYLWGRGAGRVEQELPSAARALGRDADATLAFSSHLHDLWLQVGVEFGLAGLLGWLLMLALPLAQACKRMALARAAGKADWYSWALAMGLTAFVLQGFTDHVALHARGLAVALCWGLSCALAPDRSHSPSGSLK